MVVKSPNLQKESLSYLKGKQEKGNLNKCGKQEKGNLNKWTKKKTEKRRIVKMTEKDDQIRPVNMTE